MDKKAQKKIANRINHRTYTGFDRYDMEVLTGDILDDLEELGYRKLPKGKPLIGYKALRDWIKGNLGIAVLESYESSIIKHYEG